MWWSSKPVPKPVYENVYSVLNKELERLHQLFLSEKSSSGSEKNLNVFWTRINTLQDALLKALEKQPAHAEDIRDLQNTVADMLLLTNTDSINTRS